MKRFKRIYIEITNVCNLHCSFCPSTKRVPQFISCEDFSFILDQIKPYTDYVYLHVKGEPLLHPKLEKLLLLCEENHLKINITTNGTLLGKSFSVLKNSASLRQVNISLHSFNGNKDIHFTDYINDIIDSAIYFSKHTSIITGLRLWDFKKSAGDFTQQSADLDILNYLEKAFELPSPISMDFLYRKGIQLADRVYLNIDYEFQWPALSHSYFCTEGFCHGLKNQIGILVDGTVIPCCLDGEGIINLGNIKEAEFSKIIHSKKSKTMIQGFESRKATEELCCHCSFKERF